MYRWCFSSVFKQLSLCHSVIIYLLLLLYFYNPKLYFKGVGFSFEFIFVAIPACFDTASVYIPTPAI